MPLSARRFGGADRQEFDSAGREETRGKSACAEVAARCKKAQEVLLATSAGGAELHRISC